MIRKFLRGFIWAVVISAVVACGKSSVSDEDVPPPGPEPELFDLERVAALNEACNYAAGLVVNDDGSMEMTLLRDGESVVVTAEHLASGLKVENKERYFVFSMPGAADVVLGSDIVMPYNPPLRRVEDGQTLNILCIGNSLTADTVEHLPRMLKQMGIGNVNIDVIYHGGWSLLNHWTNFRDVKCSRYIYEAGKDDWTEFDPNALDDCAADVRRGPDGFPRTGRLRAEVAADGPPERRLFRPSLPGQEGVRLA